MSAVGRGYLCMFAYGNRGDKAQSGEQYERFRFWIGNRPLNNVKCSVVDFEDVRRRISYIPSPSLSSSPYSSLSPWAISLSHRPTSWWYSTSSEATLWPWELVNGQGPFPPPPECDPTPLSFMPSMFFLQVARFVQHIWQTDRSARAARDGLRQPACLYSSSGMVEFLQKGYTPLSPLLALIVSVMIDDPASFGLRIDLTQTVSSILVSTVCLNMQTQRCAYVRITAGLYYCIIPLWM